MKEVALVLFGFLLALIPPWLTRRGRVKTQRQALRAEFNMCAKRASTYIQEISPKSPGYRAPMEAHAVAFPVLLRDGDLTEDQVTAIEEFYAQVGDFNRCLDYVHQARIAHIPGEHTTTENRLREEISRAKKKAQNILDAKADALMAVEKGI